MKLSDKLLQESPDRLYTPDGVFKFEDPGAIAFGFLNGNIVASEFTEWGDETGTHRDICNEHGVDPSDITPQGRFWEFEDPQTSEYRFYLAWWQDPNLEQIQQVIDYFNIDEDNLWIQYAGFSGVDKYVPETEVTDADRALLRDLSDEDMEDLRQQHLDAQAKARARKKGVGKFGAAATADRAAKAGYETPAQFNAQRYGESKFLSLFESAEFINLPTNELGFEHRSSSYAWKDTPETAACDTYAFGIHNGKIYTSKAQVNSDGNVATDEDGIRYGTHQQLVHEIFPEEYEGHNTLELRGEIDTKGRVWIPTDERLNAIGWWDEPREEDIAMVVNHFNLDPSKTFYEYPNYTFQMVGEGVPETSEEQRRDIELMQKQHLDAMAKGELRKKAYMGARKARADIAKKAGYPNVAQYRADRYGEAIDFLQLFETYRYETCCVNADGQDIMDLQDTAEDIDRDEFLQYVDEGDLAEVERQLGYDEDFTMEDDWHVSYHTGIYRGKPCAFFCHSRIEYIFT